MLRRQALCQNCQNHLFQCLEHAYLNTQTVQSMYNYVCSFLAINFMGWVDCGAISVREWNRKCGVKQVDTIKDDYSERVKVKFPLWRDSKADLSSVSPSSK